MYTHKKKKIYVLESMPNWHVAQRGSSSPVGCVFQLTDHLGELGMCPGCVDDFGNIRVVSWMPQKETFRDVKTKKRPFELFIDLQCHRTATQLVHLSTEHHTAENTKRKYLFRRHRWPQYPRWPPACPGTFRLPSASLLSCERRWCP